MSRKLDTEARYRLIRKIESAAIEGKRCPENWELHPDGWLMPIIAREGLWKIEISGRNFRRITLLKGSNAGKQTAPDPNGHKIFRTIP